MDIYNLLVYHLRLTTALLTDEQSDTHDYLLLHPKVCREGMVSLQAHNGVRKQHSRDINSALSLVSNLLVVISDDQSTKHRVTLFRYVVICLATLSATANIIATST